MSYFVIADIHGCLHTLRELLRHWQPATEKLVQLGDLVDRGNYSPDTVELCRQLSLDHPIQTVFLQGNHDWGLAEHLGPNGPFPNWLSWGGRATLGQYQSRREWLAPHAAWLAARPLFYETEHLLFSHAGFADVPNSLDPTSSEGVLWRRGLLQNRGKLQVVGHTPTASGRPEHFHPANVLYADTGAGHGRWLTGIRLSELGETLEIVRLPVEPEDYYAYGEIK